MPMEREAHEALLNELLNHELDHSRRTEILQDLRNDYTSVHTDFEEFNTKTTRLQRDNDDLIVSNSKLFRQAGVLEEKKEDEVKLDLSETITLESLEKGL